MTTKKLLVTFGILILVFLIGRTAFKIFNFSSSLEAERSHYVRQLSYDFSSRIDSVALPKEGGPGTVYCTITKGTMNPLIEDSLAKNLLHHTTLRFNEAKLEGQLEFVMPGAERWMSGDSLVVNSERNELTFFRSGKQMYSDRFSNLLEGRITKGL